MEYIVGTTDDAVLTVRFISKDCTLSAQTMYIDARLRGRGNLGDLNNCYYVGSYIFHNLESGGKSLCLEGSGRIDDGRVSTHEYHTPEDARLARKAFQTIIRKINNDSCTGADRKSRN